MTTIIATLLFLIFMFLSFIHIYWGFGGKWGSEAVIPTKDDNVKVMNPGLVPTFIVALTLCCFGLIALMQIIELDFNLPPWFDLIQKYGLWFIACIFILRSIGEFNFVGFFKKHKHTKFAQKDTKYYSPLCLLIGILAIVLELLKSDNLPF